MPESFRHLGFAAAAGLALVHLLAGKLRFLDGVPRNRWLSVAGGVSVAYVFLHLLPELAEGQGTVRDTAGTLVGWTVGVATEIHEAAIAVLVAFLAGGIVLNVLKEELPDERRSRFWALAAGMAGYSVLLLAT